ncbi:hypothetical protein PC121_g14582 [Phytophthora cactorum]|nr:hypothetical protein PC120_g13128 [Phytophthora cactorum]KAG3057991.1 hypothetical protein PC121_g14582 [Phytophthora cactorum]
MFGVVIWAFFFSNTTDHQVANTLCRASPSTGGGPRRSRNQAGPEGKRAGCAAMPASTRQIASNDRDPSIKSVSRRHKAVPGRHPSGGMPYAYHADAQCGVIFRSGYATPGHAPRSHVICATE